MARTNTKKDNFMSDNNQEEGNQQVQVEDKPKRLVIVTGDKGGVGKSTFARALLQLYIDKNLWCLGYDADMRNNQLRRHYEKYTGLIRCINVFDKGKADQLLIDLEEDYFPLVLVDMPAQSGGVFELFVKELSFFDILAKELGYKVTMLSVINRLRDSVNILEALHEYCGDKVNYVVVKNLFFGDEDKFGRYDSSPIRQTLKAKGLVEVLMPDLMDYCYDFIDDNDLTFGQALFKEYGSSISVRARVGAWLKDFEEKVQVAHDLLGFNCEILPDGKSHYSNLVTKKTSVEQQS
ncbi:ATP-binding protein [Scytonema hofmannii]|nr:ATP-binding protein [Scytonema hofmannii]